jgi:phage terminase large subunit
MNLHIEANKVYRPLWQTKKRYVILMGGRGAGRSFETSQKIVANLVQTTRRFRAAIMRAVHADIRHSIWQELTDRVTSWDIEPALRVADSTMEMEHGNNSVHAHGFKKSSSDRTAKLKSLAGYTDAFIEEGEEIGEDEFRQLDDSLRADGSQIYLLLNTPPKSHWVIRRWFNVVPSLDAPGFYTLELKPEFAHEVEFITSYHQDNPYLPEQVHERYESYKRLKPAYYWQMIRGYSPEVVMGRIYTGWKEIPAVPHEARLLGYGLDFGFDPDPAAIVAVYYHNGGYILDEKLYAKRLTNSNLATSIKLLPSAPIVANSAEPKSARRAAVRK